MKLQHFRNVVAIAEQGSLRAAARHLRVAQPALTRSLGELERELGASLFERRARGMTLTVIGQAFLGRAKLVLNEVRKAREEVDQLQHGIGGGVVAGLSMAAHIALLPKALKPFRARYPSVHLHIIEGFFPTLEADLRGGAVDFYIGPESGAPLPPELIEEPMFENTRTILCRKGHPRVGAKSLRDLADAEWATTSITSRAEEEMRALFESFALPPPKLAMKSQSALSLIVVLANSDLLAMVPRQWTEFGPLVESLSIIQVRKSLPAPKIVLVRRSGAPLTPAAGYFVDLLKKAASGAGRRTAARVGAVVEPASLGK